MDREEFLKNIKENPDDQTVRMVFADYLDEQGGLLNTATARFIRLSCVGKTSRTTWEASKWLKLNWPALVPSMVALHKKTEYDPDPEDPLEYGRIYDLVSLAETLGIIHDSAPHPKFWGYDRSLPLEQGDIYYKCHGGMVKCLLGLKSPNTSSPKVYTCGIDLRFHRGFLIKCVCRSAFAVKHIVEPLVSDQPFVMFYMPD